MSSTPTIAELTSEAEYHEEKARHYHSIGARFGGDAGGAARSYATYHAQQARELREKIAALEALQ